MFNLFKLQSNFFIINIVIYIVYLIVVEGNICDILVWSTRATVDRVTLIHVYSNHLFSSPT